HITWLVNSVAHVWGYRTYETGDTSRNNWWVAILTFGEGWHNNHHADQRAAKSGHEWYEIDVTYRIIQVMERLGLAFDIARPSKRLETIRILASEKIPPSNHPMPEETLSSQQEASV
ncbi:MAG: acyl-CoA desaturase, partial [Cyanobacteria bacterium]|nr:acyl-CoA desaturase [Cyanobacteriota bacterium]